MRTTWKATGIALATLAAVAATTGAAAAYSGSGGAGSCTGAGPQATAGANGGFGQHSGMGMGRGQRGPGIALANLASGTLTNAQRTTLIGMAEEEKLAHDVYVSLASTFPQVVQFERIAGAEAQHLATVRVLLDRYGIDDPTAGLDVGKFSDRDVTALYSNLLDRATTASNALAVGVTVEAMDIADLDDAMAGLTAPDVLAVYTHLQQGSERHLAAFGG